MEGTIPKHFKIQNKQLENIKYKITGNKVENLINNDLDSSWSDESVSVFDKVSDNGLDNDESND